MVAGAKQAGLECELVGRGGALLTVELEHVPRPLDWMGDEAARDRSNGMKLILEPGDHTEVPTGTAKAPEDFPVVLRTGP